MDSKMNENNQYSYQPPDPNSYAYQQPPHPSSYAYQQPPPYTLPEPIKVTPTNIADAENGRAQNMNASSTNTMSSSQWGDMAGFSDKTIRIGFIRKVYLLLSIQLIFTFGIVLVFTLVDSLKTFARSDTGFILYIVSYVIFLVLIISSMCLEKRLRKVPWNYVFLSLITLSMTYMLSMVAAYNKAEAVVIAVGITLLITIGVTIFAMQTKFDFTKNCIMLAICLCFVLIGFGFACIFVRNNILQAVYGALGALVFAIFLAIDTQMIIGNKRYAYNPEDYVSATLQLYLDICQIFLYLLTLLGSKK